jgi:hypothetical protein
MSSAKMMFFRSDVHNEVDSSDNLSQVFVVDEIVLSPPSCTIVCKICGSSPMCVQTCICRMYYVVHLLSDLSKTTIHLRMHKHPIFK